MSQFFSASHRHVPQRRRSGQRAGLWLELLESRVVLDARLAIFVDSVQVGIPANIGVDDDGQALSQVRTLTDDGVLIVAPIDDEPLAEITLGDFFATWQTNAGAAGNNPDAILTEDQLLDNVADGAKSLQMIVNGAISDEFDQYVLQEDDQIVLAFGSNPIVSVNTNFGPLVIELFSEATPITVANFLTYVNDGDYEDSFFHRSVEDFVIQACGFTTTSTTFTSTAQFSSVPTDDPIQNEFGISNTRGTVAMAKLGGNPDSATSQFFVSLDDNSSILDPQNGGFTVFGQVLDMSTADRIAALPIDMSNPSPYDELPLSDDDELVVIESVVGQGTLSGVKFLDENANGIQDNGEDGVPNATVFVDSNDNGTLDSDEPSTTTDADGRFRLHVEPGANTVRTTVAPGHVSTLPQANSYSTTVGIGGEVVDLVFGEATDSTASPDSFTVDEDNVLTIDVVEGVLANDDSNWDTVELVAAPGHGTVNLNSDGSFTYTPEADFFGNDFFTYRASDGAGDSSGEVAVSILVNAQVDPPTAVDDSFTIPGGTELLDVLANDSADPDGIQDLTITTVTPSTQGGQVTISGDSIEYAPPSGFVGEDTFTYTIEDTDGLSDTATVTVTVTAAADSGITGHVYLDADGDGEFDANELGVPGVLITLTGTDSSGEAVSRTAITLNDGSYRFLQLVPGTYQVTQAQPHALIDGDDSTQVPDAVAGNDQISNLVLTANQTLTGVNFGEADLQPEYLSITWFFASASSPSSVFREMVAVGEERAGNADLAAAIREGDDDLDEDANSVPIAVADSYEIDVDTTLTTTSSSGVLANDIDADGDVLTAELEDEPNHGTLTFNDDGSFTYTPDTGFAGVDEFTYRAVDGTDSSNIAKVNIRVLTVDVNTFEIPEGSAAGTLVGQVTADSVMGDTLAYEFDDPSLREQLRLVPDDHISGDPAASTVLIEYLDFQCPVCRAYHPIVEQLEDEFDGDLLVVRRHLPLSSIHFNAEAGARAAEAAGRQGRFLEMGDLLFENQPDWEFETDPQPFFEDYAQQLGLDLELFRLDMNDPTVDERIQRDSDAAAELGANATPTFFLNGQDVTLPQDFAAASDIIQTEIDAVDAIFSLDRTTGEIFVADSNALDFETDPTYTLTVNVTDLIGITSTVQVTINLTDVNELAPVAVDDSYNATQGVELSINDVGGVLANDTDTDSETLTAELLTSTNNGTLTLNDDGSFTYLSDAGFSGTDTFTYRASDGELTSATATVTITVATDTNGPVAAGDTYDVLEDNTLSVLAAEGVLQNDTGNSLTAQLVTTTTNGALALSADGSFTYTPDANFNGSDSFTYQASDGSSTSSTATVTIVVEAVNDTPLTVADTYNVQEDEVLSTDAASGILANDSDADDDELFAGVFSGPSNGTLTLNDDGSFTYTPNANFQGVDSFVYRVNDGILISATETVTITVESVNDEPVAADESYDVAVNVELNVDVGTGVLVNDQDIDNDPLTVTLATGPSDGTLTLNADGSFTYLPDTDFHGIDSFTYVASDGELTSAEATVEIVVNSLPSAVGDAYSVDENGILTRGAVDGVLANDSDADGDVLTASPVSPPSHGNLTINSDGSFQYTPNAGFNGIDTFSYRVNDGFTDSPEATVTIEVLPVNATPVTSPDNYATDEDVSLVIDAAAGLLANDSDPDGDVMTVTLVDDTFNGALTLNGDGSFTYVPDANYAGNDLFSYTVSDGSNTSEETFVFLTVNSVPDAPEVTNDAYVIDEDGTLTIDVNQGVLANDFDGDDDPLTLTSPSSVADGTLTLNADGSFVYTPNADFHGIDTFTYVATDGGLDSEPAIVTITVNPINDAPVATDDAYSTNEDETLTVEAVGGVLGNDNDVDGDLLTVDLVSTTTNGTLTLNSDGSFEYVPTANFNGTDTFSYTVTDGAETTPAATVTITVNPVEDITSATLVRGATRDATLIESDTGDLASGAGEYLFVGMTGQTNIDTGEPENALRRGILVFGTATNGIPAGATVTDVTLRLYQSQASPFVGPTGENDIHLHRVTTAWGEGSSDAGVLKGQGTAAEPNDATWLHTFYDAENWSTAGGDFVAAPSATITVGSAEGFYEWSSAEMIADVQAWLADPTSNFGWIIIGEESTPSARRFDTRENAAFQNRPQLTISYQVSDTPAAAEGEPDSQVEAADAIFANDDNWLA